MTKTEHECVCEGTRRRYNVDTDKMIDCPDCAVDFDDSEKMTKTETVVVCPNCKLAYKPILKKRKMNKLIQHEFPNATAMEREQLLTGICSDKCWNEYLNVNGEGR